MSSQKLILLPTGIAVDDASNMVLNVDAAHVMVNKPLTVHADVKVHGGHFTCVNDNETELLSVDAYSVKVNGPITVSSGMNVASSGYLNVAVGDPANDEHNVFQCIDQTYNQIFAVDATSVAIKKPMRVSDVISCTVAETGEPVLEVNSIGSIFYKPVNVASALDVTGAVKFNGGDFEYDPTTQTLIVNNLVVKGSFSNSNTIANSFTVVSPEGDATTTTQ